MISAYELRISIANLKETLAALETERDRIERIASQSEQTIAERLRAAEWALLHFRLADSDALDPEACEALLEELQIDDTSPEGLHEQADFAFEQWARLVGRDAQGIEARQGEDPSSGLHPKDESPVGEADAP